MNQLTIENQLETCGEVYLWDTLPAGERAQLAEKLLAAAMEGAGYERTKNTQKKTDYVPEQQKNDRDN